MQNQILVNLCGIGLKDFINIDISWRADKRVDLEKKKIPLKDNSVDALICMSAINYFTKERAEFIIKDVHRVLKPGGVCRFGVQDLRLICERYLAGDSDFTCDRINRWFGLGDGYVSNGKKCKYVYDYETLNKIFREAGFKCWVSCSFGYSWTTNYLAKYDNRGDQMFFLEAMK